MSTKTSKLSFSNVKIGRKITLAFAALILTVGIVSGVSYVNMQFVQQMSSDAVADMETASDMGDLLEDAVAQQTAIRGLLITGDVKYIDSFRDAAKQFDAGIVDVLEAEAKSQRHIDAMKEIETLMGQWRTDFAEKQIELVRHPMTIDQARVMESTGKSAELFDKMFAVAKQERANIMQSVQESQSALYDATATMIVVIIAGAVASLVFAIFFGVALARGIATPINNISGTMNRLSGGEKDAEIPYLGRGDEVGEMAQALETFKNAMQEAERLAAEQAEMQRMAAEEQAKAAEEREKAAQAQAAASAEQAKRAEKLQELTSAFERHVQEVLGSVNAAVTQLGATSDEMNQAAEVVNGQSQNVSAAATEASTNVQTVAVATEELTSSITEIGAQVSNSSKIAQQAVDQAEKTNVLVSGLSESANRINEVIEMITDIADKTNLLALNATIEAARAGDAGKGFAVVATEVGRLAEQTTRSTDEIASQISAVQKSTVEAVEAIREISATIGQINEVSSAIAAAVEEQTAATQEIARNIEQAATGTEGVTASIAEVSTAAGQTRECAGQVRQASGAVAQRSEELTQHVDEFLKGVRAA